jgi:putative ABC transport system permease protein
VILGKDIVEKLFINEEALGQAPANRRPELHGVGVLASKGTSFGESQDLNAITPITQFPRGVRERSAQHR